MRCLTLLFLICGLAVMSPAISQEKPSGQVKGQYLYTGLSENEPIEPTQLMRQPNGPFAVMAFDEGPLSVFIGVVYYEPMTNPGDGAWRIGDRFWQKGDWVADVTSFAWGKSGRYLYVGTANAYGDGGLFRLDLLNRTSARIFPSQETLKKAGLATGKIETWSYATTIVSVDPEKSRMAVELTVGNYKPLRVDLDIQ